MSQIKVNEELKKSSGTIFHEQSDSYMDAGCNPIHDTIYSGSLIRLQNFRAAGNLLFRSRWQLSNADDLTSFEQIIIGGVASVRGYTEGLSAGDKGYALTAEYVYPPGFVGGWVQCSNVITFFDTGAAFPFRGDDGAGSESEDFIASVGVGLDFDVF